MNTTFLVFSLVMAAGGVFLVMKWLATGLRWVGGLAFGAVGSIGYGRFGGHDISHMAMAKLQPLLGSREIRKLLSTLVKSFL